MNQKKEIFNNVWKNLYEKRCLNHFIPLNKLVEEINLNCFLYDKPSISDWVYESPCNCDSIIRILEKAKDMELELPKSVKDMACEACACNGCSYLKEHLGFTCEECRRDYCTGYQGYCDE